METKQAVGGEKVSGKIKDILPRCVLPARIREQGQSASKVVRAACKKWREGKAAELWEEAKGKKEAPKKGRKRKEKETPTQLERNVQRATRLAEEGQLGRAAKALVSKGCDDVEHVVWLKVPVEGIPHRLQESGVTPRSATIKVDTHQGEPHMRGTPLQQRIQTW